MYWHIDTDIVALIVMIALYYYTIRMLPNDGFTAQNRGFVWCLRCGIIMAAIDIAASVIMEVPTTRFLYHLLMTSYLLIQDMMILSWFLYALTILYPEEARLRKRVALTVCAPYVVYAALVLANPWTELFYSLGPNLEYTREAMFLPIVLGLYYAYAVALLLLICIRRRHVPDGYPKIVLAIQPILLGVAIPIQLANDGWLLVFSAYMICLVLAFLFFQNLRVRNERTLLKQLTDMVEHFAAGVAISEIDADRNLKVIYLSREYSEIFEQEASGLLEQYGQDLFAGIHPDDREKVRAATERYLKDLTNYELTYRYITATGRLKWINTKMEIVRHPDGTATSFSTYTDITEQYNARQQLTDVVQTVPCGICLYRWDGERLIPLMANAQFSELLGLDAVSHLEETGGLDYKFVHPDDVLGLKQASMEGLLHTHEIDYTFRVRNQKSGQYAWLRERGVLIPQQDGSELAYVSYFDVTQEHLTEQQLRERERELTVKFELERRRASMADESLLVHAVFNLTQGKALEYCYRDGSEVPIADRTTFAYSEAAAKLLIDERERLQFLALNDAEDLMERFAHGEEEFRLDYRRRLPSGEICWIRSSLHLVRDPDSGDILLFEYWYNIEEEKMRDLMYRSIASDNYDFVTRIDGQTKRFAVLAKTGLTYHMPPQSGEDADAVTLSIYDNCATPEDRELAIRNCLVENIKENLKKSGRFQFTYCIRRPDGTIRHKKITQYYIDSQRETIAMLREDVTDIIRDEAEKNRILAEALNTANQASSAKSQFLSRVSHELRTPLNAIIGFMELAKGADAEQIETYLDNSDVAAKQLLSIINDVLDVSSIESGKLKIAHAPFDFKHLIHSITNIYVVQCNQKGLQYETKLLTPVDEWLLGDPLRVNQILLNLLNNALKFTKEGHVWLTISQKETQNSKVIIRFTVTDTGCGMSEEMQKRLFKPFEQENASTAQKYGGNGLGLSIVGSLVNMMDGVVRVESRKGEGSSFIVDLPFTKSEAEIALESIDGVDGLRVLSVDDEPLEREYISTVMRRMGVRHACVSDGNAALEELNRSHEAGDGYNVCLVDWKMPDMNGIETTRRIRKEYGEHLVVIVVSAYEHHQADERARAAGADMFIAKPLFQSSLFDLFSTLTGGRIVRKEDASASCDLTGMRVLLVEDNSINRMVAEGLIRQRFEALCEDAENGRAAVDMFLASPSGYYDAILMDIQMPDMDGYEATRVIRESSHTDAKTIQITLTANAFNEDVARSLASGMNAHVAKPIEPHLLGDALRRAYQEKHRPPTSS